MRFVWGLLMVLLPSPAKRHLGRWVYGWDIHPTAHLGRSVVLVRHLSMGPGSSIGARNVIRGLDELRLGEGAVIATRNFISAFPSGSDVFPHSPRRETSLVLGDHAMITVAHEIDCSDRVELGRHAVIAGFRCQVLTHSLNLVRDRQVTAPVTIGDRSAVMSGSILQSGSRVPARCIVSAGSVVNTRLTRELTFYRGNPAEPVRSLPEDLAFFHRQGEAPADREAPP